MYGYIYMISCKYDGTRYIGQHKSNDISDRYMGSGKIIKAKIKKHGRDQFEKTILAIADSQEDLDLLEEYYISSFDAVNDPRFLNIDSHTHGCGKVIAEKYNDPEWSANVRKHMSESAKNRETFNTPPKHSKEQLQQWANERWADQSNRDAAATKTKTYWDSEEGQARKAAGPVFTKPFDSRKRVKNITTGEIYESQDAAAKALGVSFSMISKHLRGKAKSVRGFTLERIGGGPNES